VGMAGLGILLFRQDYVLNRVVKNQRPMVEAAIRDTRKVESLVQQLQGLGRKYPDYQANVLAHFQLPPPPQAQAGGVPAAAPAPAAAKPAVSH
jgi:hypothetical protein